MKDLTIDQVKALHSDLESKGLLNGGAGFETVLQEGSYTGTAKGTFSIINFTYKSGANAGKPAFMTLANVKYESTDCQIPVNKSDLGLFNNGVDVTFKVAKDANGVKRLSLVKGVTDVTLGSTDKVAKKVKKVK